MSFTKQDRSGVVTLSEAKGLARWVPRCFAALSMTGPLLVVTFHHRRWRGKPAPAVVCLQRVHTHPAGYLLDYDISFPVHNYVM
jgi:hypothetical protein